MARSLPIRLRTIAAAAVVVSSGLIIFNAYKSIINTTDPMSQTLPIIKADNTPFRVLPDNPGGAEIPNQGSRLFNVLNVDNPDDLALNGVKIDREEVEPTSILAESQTDQIGFVLPEIHEPKRESLYNDIDTLKDRQIIEVDPQLDELDKNDKDQLKEKLKSVIKVDEENNDKIIVSENITEDEALEDADEEMQVNEVLVPKPIRKPNNTIKTAINNTNAFSNNTKIDKPVKEFSVDRILSSDTVKNRHYIQLASLKSEDAARQAYERIRDVFPKLVKGVSVVFPMADLGSRGVFYRIQVGPLSVTEANKRCEEYRSAARGGTCLVVSR